MIDLFEEHLRNDLGSVYHWESLCISTIIKETTPNLKYHFNLGRGAGKTTFCCWLAKELACNYPGLRIAIRTVNAKHVSRLLSQYDSLKRHKEDKYGCPQEVTVTEDPLQTMIYESIIDIIEGSDVSNKLRGKRYDFIIRDETFYDTTDESVYNIASSPFIAQHIMPAQLILATKESAFEDVAQRYNKELNEVSNIL